jgi:hypothetical protein
MIGMAILTLGPGVSCWAFMLFLTGDDQTGVAKGERPKRPCPKTSELTALRPSKMRPSRTTGTHCKSSGESRWRFAEEEQLLA